MAYHGTLTILQKDQIKNLLQKGYTGEIPPKIEITTELLDELDINEKDYKSQFDFVDALGDIICKKLLEDVNWIDN